MAQVFEIALQTTTFIKWDGTRIVLPNSYLFANMLSNMTRSNDKGEVFKVIALPLLCCMHPTCQAYRSHEYIGHRNQGIATTASVYPTAELAADIKNAVTIRMLTLLIDGR